MTTKQCGCPSEVVIDCYHYDNNTITIHPHLTVPVPGEYHLWWDSGTEHPLWEFYSGIWEHRWPISVVAGPMSIVLPAFLEWQRAMFQKEPLLALYEKYHS